MRTFVVALIITLVCLQYKLWLGDGGLHQWHQLEEKLAEQTERNGKMLVRNRAVEADIAGLKSGDQALEEQARFELGMVKEGESYYQLIE